MLKKDRQVKVLVPLVFDPLALADLEAWKDGENARSIAFVAIGLGIGTFVVSQYVRAKREDEKQKKSRQEQAHLPLNLTFEFEDKLKGQASKRWRPTITG